MTADRKALTVLALGLLIDLAALLGLQTLGGLPDDALVLVILAIAQIGALVFAARRVNRARVWILCAGIVELAIALFWVIAAPHSSGPPVSTAPTCPTEGDGYCLG